MPTLAVVGGGISGLSLAYFLRQVARPSTKIVVLEAGHQLGGWTQTLKAPTKTQASTFQFECGPRGFRPSRNGVEVLRLIEELGLTAQMRAIDANANARYLLQDGKIEALPSSLRDVLKWPLKKEAFAAGLRDLRTPKSGLEDESVYDFISRRFSPVLAERLVDPMCSGICGGDVRYLSMRSFFAGIHELEQKHGSVLRGMMAERKPKKEAAKNATLMDGSAKSAFVRQYENSRSITFEGGMHTIIQALAQEIEHDANAEIMTGSKVVEIARKDANGGLKLQIQHEGGKQGPESIEASHVFSTIPAFQLADVMRTSAPTLSEALGTIKFADMATILVGYNQQVLNRPGFGYLVPSIEKEKVLGVVFDSNAFPTQNALAYPQQTRLSVMCGGAHHPEIAQLRNDQLETLALDALRRHLGITAPPDFVSVHVLHKSIPQYHVGFYKTLEQIESNVLPGMQLGGNSFYGVGVTDCIARSKALALQYARQAGSTQQ